MAREPSEIDSVQGRAIRLGADVRRRRLAAGLTQQMLAGRIGYDRSYLSQVETGAQIPAEQFILQCERESQAAHHFERDRRRPEGSHQRGRPGVAHDRGRGEGPAAHGDRPRRDDAGRRGQPANRLIGPWDR